MKKLICFILLFAVILNFNIPVSAEGEAGALEVAWSQSFESGKPGALPEGMDVRETDTTGTVRIAESYDGGMCVNIKNDEASPTSQAFIQISPAVSLTGTVEISYRIYCEKAFGSINLPQVYDSGGNGAVLVKLTTLGKLGAYEKIVGKCTDGWLNIRTVIDIENSVYSVYTNDVLTAEKFDLPKPLKDVSVIRFAMYKSNGGSIFLDDITLKAEKSLAEKIVSAGTVQTGSSNKSELVLSDAVKAEIRKITSGSLVMAVGSSKVLKNGTEHYTDENFQQKPVITNGRTMVPLRFVAECFDAEVEWKDAERRAVIKTKNPSKELIFEENISEYLADGVSHTMDAPAYISDGRFYVPVRFAAEALGKKVFWDDIGLIVIGDSENPFDTEEKQALKKHIYQMVRYIRPSAEEMIERLKKTNPQNAHPRLILTDEKISQIKERIATDEFSSAMYKYIKTQADAIFKMDVGTYSIKEVYRLGDDTKLSGPRIEKLALMYLLSGEEKYAERAWDELYAVCTFPDWNAHQHYLDTGRLLGEVALGYDWLYDYLSEERREIIRNALIEKGMQTGLDVYEGKIKEPNLTVFWITNGYNWNATCNGGLITAALAIGDEESEISGKILEHALVSTEYLLETFAPDGGWVEGSSYWRITAETLIHTLAKMQSALGTYYDYLNADGISETCFFAKYTNGSVMPFNFSDGGATSALQLPFLFWAADELGNPTLANDRKEEAERKGAYEVYDLIWYNPEFDSAGKSEIGFDNYIRKLEVATLRNGWDLDSTFIGFRAGDNSPSHAHYDIGSFVLDSMGERWFEDLGSDRATYTGTAKAKAYRLRAEGHNTFVLNNSKSAVEIIKNKEGLTRVAYDDFEAYADGDSPSFGISTAGSGQISMPKDGDNRYLKLSCADTVNTTKAYIQQSFSDFGGALSGDVAIEFRIRLDKAQGDISPVNVRDSGGTESGAMITFTKNGTLLVNNSGDKEQIMEYALNEWYDIKLIIDTDASEFDVYVNGKLMAKNCGTGRIIENISLVRFPIFYKIVTMCLDNIAIYADVTSDEIKNSANEASDQTKGFSPITHFVTKPKGGFAIADITPAYATWAKSAKRGVMLSGNRQQVIVRDEIQTKSPMDYYWFAHTKADIEISENGKEAWLSLGGKKLYARILSQENAVFGVMEAKQVGGQAVLGRQTK